ncbi:hypothetical protein K501DRAFT_304286 [Backusella circina FSU 941]|nr:hypothetical protein K501DRAFT_304286 [Backusella circina FSU 941]
MFFVLLYVIFLCSVHLFNTDDSIGLKASSVIEYGLERLTAIESASNDCFKRASVELYKECPTMDFHSIKNMKYAVLLSICEFTMVGAELPKGCDEKLLTETKKIKACAKYAVYLNVLFTLFSTNNPKIENFLVALKHGQRIMVILKILVTLYIWMICFSIRYPIEKEAISLLYRNISEIQLETTNILKEQQKYLMEWRHEEIAHYENIINIQRKVSSQSKNIKKLMNQTVTQLGDYFDILLILQKQAESGLEKQNQEIQTYVDEARIQMDKLAYEKDISIGAIFELFTNELQAINYQMSEMDNLQEDKLKQWTEIKEVQENYILEWKQALNVVDSCIQSVLAYTLQEVQNAEKNLNIIHLQLEDTFFWVDWITIIFHKLYRVIEFLSLHAFFWYHVLCLFNYLGIRLRYLIFTFLLTTLLVPFNIKTLMNNYSPFIGIVIAINQWVVSRIREQHRLDHNSREDYDGGSFSPSSSSSSSAGSFFSVHNTDSLPDYDFPDDLSESVPGIPVDNRPLHSNSNQTVPSPQYYFHRYYRNNHPLSLKPLQAFPPQSVPYPENNITLPQKKINSYYFHRYYRNSAFGQEA